MQNKDQIKLRGSYNFSKISYNILQEIVDIDLLIDFSMFDSWFNYSYKLKEDEVQF